MTIDQEIQRAAEILAGAKNAAASCGAGISAESGIATFRDPGGVWERVNPAEVGTADGLMATLQRSPEKLLPFFRELLDTFEQAEPNAAHVALRDLEHMGILKTVVTQNIDNLHLEAGNTDVVEVHGNSFRFRCLSCAWTRNFPRRELIRQLREKVASAEGFTLSEIIEIMPKCQQCQSVTRPDVVMFGEAVQEIPRAFDAARKCDVMLAVGTSGVVYPAAYLPFQAKEAGARVIVINPNENAFQRVSDAYIPLKAGEAMPKLVEAVKSIITG
ncbi:MAG: SIR2 family NAD-dependent protein deacylase [Desulfobacterales bacterium]